ncbi:MAG TPA: YkgJ family cysteine cluster protein [Bryobacteraceae bacterium]|nr:YkgJ family cysteine cluster protein [Bryobacteraceae bacterium]
MPGTIDRYLEICRAVEEEFARNRRLHGPRIQCRAGCSDCCHQLFQITEVEAARISAGVRTLPADVKNRLAGKAKPYLAAREKLVSRTGEPEAWGSLPVEGTRLACPALEDGACEIYEYRPLICRKFGIPLYNPDKPGRVFACELNFRDGEEIEDGQLIQIQTGIHESWKEVQKDYNDGGGFRDSKPITVARAIAEDFSHCL